MTFVKVLLQDVQSHMEPIYVGFKKKSKKIQAETKKECDN